MYRNQYHIVQDQILWNSRARQSLDCDTIHIYKSNLSPSIEEVKSWESILSEDEILRASKFHFMKDKNRYIKARGVTRTIIGSYLEMDPKDVYFKYSPFGKPSINGQHLHFNISHAQQYGLFAFSRTGDIGVDVELVKPEIDFDKLVSRFFSPSEAQVILGLDKNLKAEYFCKCWTRKESFIKAHGMGLSMPLDCFEVSILDKEKVLLKSLDWVGESHKNWNTMSFEIDTNVIGAFTYKGEQLAAKFIDFDLGI